MMYGESFEVTDEEMHEDYLLEIGKGNIERKGNHVTIVGFAKVFSIILRWLNFH